MVCIFTDWHVTVMWLSKPQIYDALCQMLFWHCAYFRVISMLNWRFSHMCKMQSMKTRGLIALSSQARLRFACLVVQLIKQLNFFQDSLTPTLSFIFLSFFFKEKKKAYFHETLRWQSSNLYERKTFFGTWNANGNISATSVCVIRAAFLI